LIKRFADEISELAESMINYFHNENDKKIEENFFNTLLPEYYGILNRKIEKNKSGYLIGDRLTWIDLFLFSVIEWLSDERNHKLIESCPYLKAHCEKISNEKGIKEWLSTRPKTMF
jgi:glutathione S-transferase